VPYKGSAPALSDLMGGQIDYTLETVASLVGHIKAGRLKALGVTSGKRTAGLPDVPTLAEAADIPGYDIGAWIGYAAPPGTPREILTRLSSEIGKAMQAPDLKERYLALGMDPASMAPDEMGAFLRKEQARYGSIIKNANIKVE
jgi:tripartite-type tricarboxylate transporter receptor subunit TctC